MPKPLLSKAELDALMGLFDADRSGEENVKPSGERPQMKPDVGSLKTVFETEALRWAEALEKLTGHPARVTLRTIIRVSESGAEAGEVAYGMANGRVLICAEALVNLVNEKSLGAGEEVPMVSHALSAIDRKLFEMSGAFFAESGDLSSAEKMPETAGRIEARYDIEIAPLLRTSVRLVSDA